MASFSRLSARRRHQEASADFASASRITKKTAAVMYSMTWMKNVEVVVVTVMIPRGALWVKAAVKVLSSYIPLSRNAERFRPKKSEKLLASRRPRSVAPLPGPSEREG